MELRSAGGFIVELKTRDARREERGRIRHGCFGGKKSGRVSSTTSKMAGRKLLFYHNRPSTHRSSPTINLHYDDD